LLQTQLKLLISKVNLHSQHNDGENHSPYSANFNHYSN